MIIPIPVRTMSFPRVLRLLVLAVLLPAALPAQQTDSAAMQRAYDQRRAELLKDLQDAQDSLGAVRAQRVRLEARIDNVLAQSTVERAEGLLLSGDLNALLQLDAILSQAQANMSSQRDRMLSLGDAVKKRSGAVLVVFFRADSAPANTVSDAHLQVDDQAAGAHQYSAQGGLALQHGAVDELYRGEVLPTVHTVTVTATYGGQALTGALNVQATANLVTYVQFSVKDGQVAASTWTSQGTTP